MSLIKHILTGVDNETHDAGRYALAIGVISLVAFTGWDMALGRPFAMSNYGIAFGAICTGAGALLKLKENTEPKSGA